MPENYKRSLSDLQAISQRSQFIPTISHALSVSLLRNAQSPSLRRKLLSLLSNLVQPPDDNVMMDPVDDIDNQSDLAGRLTSRSLGQIIEERLWAMMQHSLYRPSSAPCFVPPDDVGAGVHEVLMEGLVEKSTSGREKAVNVIDESLLFTGYGLEFFDDDFEDLLEDVPDERGYEEFEALFSESTNDRNIDDDFEDLLQDGQPDKADQTVYAGVEGCEADFDTAPDSGIRYCDNIENISTGDLFVSHHFGQQEKSDIENEDMLI